MTVNEIDGRSTSAKLEAALSREQALIAERDALKLQLSLLKAELATATGELERLLRAAEPTPGGSDE